MEQSLDHQVGCAHRARLVDLRQDRADIAARRARLLAVTPDADVKVFDDRLVELDREEAYIIQDACYRAVVQQEIETNVMAAQSAADKAQEDHAAAVSELEAQQKRLADWIGGGVA